MSELLHLLRMRFKALFQRQQLDRDLEDELAFHLSMKETASREGSKRPLAISRLPRKTRVRSGPSPRLRPGGRTPVLPEDYFGEVRSSPGLRCFH